MEKIFGDDYKVQHYYRVRAHNTLPFTETGRIATIVNCFIREALYDCIIPQTGTSVCNTTMEEIMNLYAYLIWITKGADFVIEVIKYNDERPSEETEFYELIHNKAKQEWENTIRIHNLTTMTTTIKSFSVKTIKTRDI